jgi:hypothetical protein
LQKTAGGLFEKMFHYYQFNRDEYMTRYHRRSNVESTFSAIKRNFGASLRSRTNTAMVNEALGKMICQNITCVIGSQIELGLEPVFWPKEGGKEALLAFPRIELAERFTHKGGAL